MTATVFPSPTRGVLATEARLMGRELGALFWILLFPTALLLVLGAVPSFREPNPDLLGRRVIDVYVSITVLLSAIMAGVQSMPTVLSGYRERGVLRRLRATPVSPAALLRAQVLLHGAAVLAAAGLCLLVGRVAYGVPLPAQPVGWAGAFGLAVAVSLAVGATVTAVSRSARMSATLGSIVFFPLMFSSGLWIPVQAMPGLLRDVVLLTPLGASARALEDAARGDWPLLLDLGVTAGWTVVLAAVAVRAFRWE